MKIILSSSVTGVSEAPVRSLEEASGELRKWRDLHGLKATDLGEKCGHVVDVSTDRRVACVSYDGTVWGPGRWVPGAKPLVEARKFE